jgi:hypothetical protein
VVPDEARPTAMMMGRLADTVGRPIADALILVAPVTAADEMWWASGSCKVDPGTGRFEGGPFPPGRYRVQVNSESFGPRDLGSRELAAGKTLDLGAIAFEAPGTADLAFSLEAGEPPIQAQWTLDRRRPDGTWQRLTQDQVKGARVMNLGPGSYRIGVNGNYARGQQREFEIKSGEVTRVEFGIDRAPMRSVRVTGPSTPMAATVLRLRAFDDHGVLQYEANIGRNLEEDFFRAWAFLVAGTYEFVLTPDRGEETRATLEFGETTGLAAGDTPEIRLR